MAVGRTTSGPTYPASFQGALAQHAISREAIITAASTVFQKLLGKETFAKVIQNIKIKSLTAKSVENKKNLIKDAIKELAIGILCFFLAKVFVAFSIAHGNLFLAVASGASFGLLGLGYCRQAFVDFRAAFKKSN